MRFLAVTVASDGCVTREHIAYKMSSSISSLIHADIQAACSTLGGWDDGKYHKEPECIGMCSSLVPSQEDGLCFCNFLVLISGLSSVVVLALAYLFPRQLKVVNSDPHSCHACSLLPSPQKEIVPILPQSIGNKVHRYIC